ncbi:hypothetical protein C8Q79DRAFT_526014 [Trametes meyenii]|nr:hypothetical protein C8Q79DRAFT_526014 [Trametes meyenii]
MFFCRHHLLRAPAQRHFASLVTTRNAIPRSVPAASSSKHGYLRFAHARPPAAEAIPSHSSTDTLATDTSSDSADIQTNTADTDTFGASSSEAEDTLVTEAAEKEKEHAIDLPFTASPKEVEEFKRKVRENPLGIYLAVRKGGADALTTYSSEFIASAIWHCVHTNRPQYLPIFVQDAILIMDQREGKIRGRTVMEVIFSTLNLRRALTKKDAIALLQCMKKHDQLRYMRTAIRAVLARTLMTYAPDDELDRELLELLLPLLLEKVGTLTDRNLVSTEWASKDALDSTDSGIALPRVLWPLYQMTLRLAQLGEKVKASDLLATLVDRRYIDPQAIQATDLSSQDLVYVVLSVCVRSCFKYGWFTRATALLFYGVQSKRKISSPFAQLAEDWIERALIEPREMDIKRVASMISMLFTRAPGHVLSTKLLLEFYDAAFRLNAPELAENVYARSRGLATSYPPPRDMTILRLMEYLGIKDRNVNLARVLATQVVEEKIPLLPPARAPFIAQAAILGLSSQARQLWQRYSTGRDAQLVIANGATMLRMVSVLMRVGDQLQATARRKSSTDPDAHRGNLEESASDNREEGSQATSQRTLPKEQDRPASDAPLPHTTPPPHDDSSLGEPPSDGSVASADAEGATEDQELRAFEALTYTELLEREADVRRFADHVFDVFYKAKQPLKRASHYDLTSLARGASIVRRDQLSLDVFALMKTLDMQLDMHDVNLALGVVAKTDSAAGAAYIDRMVACGVQPDAVSFGTVIHYAAQQGDTALVASLIQRARDAGFNNLTFKTLGSLLHATVTGKVAEGTSPSAQLRYAQELVSKMVHQGVTPTPNVGRDAVMAAVHAQNPVKAFTFWKRYVKGKVEWGDAAQEHLRALVASLVRNHLRNGWLDQNRGGVMLYELGFSSDAFSIARYRAPHSASSQPQPSNDGGKSKGPEDG